MDSWKTIETETDIETLLETYFGFHDACIISVSYQSGITLDHKGTMFFPNACAHQMLIRCQSQMARETLELLFIGLRQARLVGWEDNYLCLMSDAYLSFAYALLPGEPKKQIVWASSGWFDPKKMENAIREPADSYVVANELRWRLLA